MYAASDFPANQAGGFEDPKVFRNGGKGHGKGLRQRGDRGFASCEPGKDGPASGVGQGAKSGIEQSSRIVNHMV